MMLAKYSLAAELRCGVTAPLTCVDDMPYDEFLGWQQFFGERPIGWREDDRTMKLLQAQGVKERPGNIFYSLKAMQDAEARRETISAEEDKARGVSKTPKGLKGSMMFSLMSGAVGGDKID